MNNSKQINRRRFVKLSTSIVTIPLLGSNIATSQDLPQLAEDDPTAQALAYKMDAANVDTAAHPNYATGQLCSTCALYTGNEGDASGPCGIFPGKSVAATGWCSVFAPKPS